MRFCGCYNLFFPLLKGKKRIFICKRLLLETRCILFIYIVHVHIRPNIYQINTYICTTTIFFAPVNPLTFLSSEPKNKTFINPTVFNQCQTLRRITYTQTKGFFFHSKFVYLWFGRFWLVNTFKLQQSISGLFPLLEKGFIMGF